MSYNDFPSEEKLYINRYISQTVVQTAGRCMFLDCTELRTNQSLHKKGVTEDRMIIAELKHDTFTKIREKLDETKCKVVLGNIFSFLDSYNFQNLYLDLMASELTDVQLEQVKKWLIKVIYGYGSKPNLFITLSLRSPSKGKTFAKRFAFLNGFLSLIHPLLRCKRLYGYSRKKRSAGMAFMHFCFHEGDTEYRPQKIEGYRGKYCIVKWWGFDQEYNTLEDKDSEVVRILELNNGKNRRICAY